MSQAYVMIFNPTTGMITLWWTGVVDGGPLVISSINSRTAIRLGEFWTEDSARAAATHHHARNSARIRALAEAGRGPSEALH